MLDFQKSAIFETPNNELIPVFILPFGFGLKKVISILFIKTKNNKAGINRLILLE